MPFSFPSVAGKLAFPSFEPIAPTDRDDLVLPRGFGSHVVIAYGDRFTRSGERFGFNCDFTAFFPRNDEGTEGLLVVNHEFHGSVDNYYGQAFSRAIGGVPNVRDMKFDVGVSVVHVAQQRDGRWSFVDSELNRRLYADSLAIASGPALGDFSDVGGTLANCSGCRTPWNTVLTCEENYQESVPEDMVIDGRGSIGGFFGKDGTHFGWVVEFDPHDPASVPVKHTALGRFRHENVALRAHPGHPVIAYMGDDRTNGHIYKFISDRLYIPGSEANKTLLLDGRLYSALFGADGRGRWQPLAQTTRLDPIAGSDVPRVSQSARTLGDVYGSLGNILIDAYRASNLIGSTPTGRPEDVEVHPFDSSVYIAFTASASIPRSPFTNVFGEIVRIVEDAEDALGTEFSWQRWKAGGAADDRGGDVFAAPDNMSFDRAGNMWLITDISTLALNANGPYERFKNNGMFVVPTFGPEAGVAFQFASGPCECELTGPSWTPNEETLFLSVQHPGEVNGTRTSSAMAPRGSNWPHRSHGAPLPAVVAIQRR